MTPPTLPLELRKHFTHLSQAKSSGRGATVTRMVQDGRLQKLRPGLYRPAERETWLHQDLLDACAAVPDGVICLVSALAFHGLTTTIPAEVWIAIPKEAWVPKLAFPARFIRMGERTLEAGLEKARIHGQSLRLFGKSKSVCDALRFRDKIGTEVALEALKTFLRQGGKPDDLLQWETACRVRGILRPTLEAMLA